MYSSQFYESRKENQMGYFDMFCDKIFTSKSKKPIRNFLVYGRLGCENPNVTLPLPKSIILLAFFSRYPLHFDLLVSGTDTKTWLAKRV